MAILLQFIESQNWPQYLTVQSYQPLQLCSQLFNTSLVSQIDKLKLLIVWKLSLSTTDIIPFTFDMFVLQVTRFICRPTAHNLPTIFSEYRFVNRISHFWGRCDSFFRSFRYRPEEHVSGMSNSNCRKSAKTPNNYIRRYLVLLHWFANKIGSETKFFGMSDP